MVYILIKIISNNFYVIKKLYNIKSSYLFIKVIESIIGTTPSIISVILTKTIIDNLVLNKPLNKSLLIIFITAFVFLVNNIINLYIQNLYMPRALVQIESNIQQQLYSKLMISDLSDFDDSNFYDNYIKAAYNIKLKIFMIYDNITQFISTLFAIGAIGTFIIILDKTMLIFGITIVVLNVYFNTIKAKKQYDRDMESEVIKRKRSYIDRLFYHKCFAKEMRTSSIGLLSLKKFNNMSQDIEECMVKHGMKMIFINSVISLNQIVTMIVPMIYLTWKIWKGELSVGDFAALNTAVSFLSNYLSNLFNIIPNFYSNSNYINDYLNFEMKKPIIERVRDEKGYTDGNNINIKEIKLKDVSFRYTDEANYAIKNVNITIKKGEKIAIVGDNGSGKSTLTKLIARLYDVTSGCIYLNGLDIKSYDINNYRSNINIIHQDFNVYAFNTVENVLLKENMSDNDYNLLVDSLRLADIEELGTCGFNTPLSREFEDGIELSGGQKQKIALARFFAQSGDILILDEPNSALDPISEDNIINNLIKWSIDKTVIIISHRLSMVKDVNNIIYMEKGSIVEQGSHEELMTLNGKYATSFNKQAEKYT